MCQIRQKMANNYINENEEDSSDNENNVLISTVMKNDSIDSPLQNVGTNLVLIPHKHYTTEACWENRKPLQDPIIHVKVSACQHSYKSNQVKCPTSYTIIPAVADTGTKTTVAGTAMVKSL